MERRERRIKVLGISGNLALDKDALLQIIGQLPADVRLMRAGFELTEDTSYLVFHSMQWEEVPLGQKPEMIEVTVNVRRDPHTPYETHRTYTVPSYGTNGGAGPLGHMTLPPGFKMDPSKFVDAAQRLRDEALHKLMTAPYDLTKACNCDAAYTGAHKRGCPIAKKS